MTLNIIPFTPGDKRKLKQFVRFPLKLYKNDPNYVAPMKMDLIGNRLLGVHGLLCDDHPFHKHGTVRYFMAENEKGIVGRLACCVNDHYNTYHNTRIGVFGFFEVIDDYDIAKSLLDKGIQWLQQVGMTDVLGPMNFSTNESLGLLIEGFDHYPFMETPYNKKYYQDFIERYGFMKEKDMFAQLMPVKQTEQTQKRHDRLKRITERIKSTKNITIRPIDLGKGFLDDIKLMRKIYTQAWNKNWGFVPITEEEMIHAAQNMKLVADKGLFHFAYVKGEPAGFIGSLPDVNEMIGSGMNPITGSDYFRVLMIFLKRRKVKRVRLFLFGILESYKKIGLDAVLYHESFKNAHESGHYEECEISWLLEDNILVLRAGESMGAKQYKTWRIFKLPISS